MLGQIAHIELECPQCGRDTNAYIVETGAERAEVTCQHCRRVFEFGPGMLYNPLGYVSAIPPGFQAQGDVVPADASASRSSPAVAVPATTPAATRFSATAILWMAAALNAVFLVILAAVAIASPEDTGFLLFMLFVVALFDLLMLLPYRAARRRERGTADASPRPAATRDLAPPPSQSTS